MTIKNLTGIALISCLFVSNLVFGQTEIISTNKKIYYVDNVNSLDALFGKFKGQLIYVDFWASWCSSCLDEFKPEPELDAFISSNNIVRLYIALEYKESDSLLTMKSIEKWKSLVEKYNLTGFNYYSQLRTEFFKGITEKIMKGKLSLPRFAIIDKQGVIIEREDRKSVV